MKHKYQFNSLGMLGGKPHAACVRCVIAQFSFDLLEHELNSVLFLCNTNKTKMNTLKSENATPNG